MDSKRKPGRPTADRKNLNFHARVTASEKQALAIYLKTLRTKDETK